MKLVAKRLCVAAAVLLLAGVFWCGAVSSVQGASQQNTVASNLLRTGGKFNTSLWTEPADKSAYSVQDDPNSATGSVYSASSPENGSRVATKTAIATEGNTKKAAKLTATLYLAELAAERKVGFAFGLAAADTAISADGVSFVYFYNGGDGTYVSVMKDGIPAPAGTKLSVNYLADHAAMNVELISDSKGNFTLTVGSDKVTFPDQHIDGLAAIATLGTGAAAYSIGEKVTIYYYIPKFGEGADVANNFDAGYIDINELGIQSTATNHFVDPAEAAGIVFEDGTLFFKGTYDTAFLATASTYADFIAEFDYISIPVEERPAIVDSWTAGYSWLGFGFGKPQQYSLGSASDMVLIYDYNFGGESFVEFYEVGKSVQRKDLGEDAGFTIYEKTTRFKIAVFDNECRVYAVNMENGKPVGEYQLLISRTFADTYGYVSLETTNCGYLKIDNFKVKNVDNKYASMEEALEGYKDFEEIVDQYDPKQVAAPVITLNSETGTVSWEAVEHAKGYIVTVNGRVGVLNTATSYKIEASKSGDYVVTVKAVADGSKNDTFGYIWALDSEESNAVTYTAVVNDNKQTPSRGCGCGSVFFGGGSGGSWLVVGLAAAALIAVTAVMLKKKAKIKQ